MPKDFVGPLVKVVAIAKFVETPETLLETL